jgi:hypothetical protein
MSTTLNFSEKLSEALKKVAESEGISMYEVALTTIDSYDSKRQNQLKAAIQRVATDDTDLLARLAQ